MSADGVHYVRTGAEDPGFRRLVRCLDDELAARDGAEHGFYHQFNGLDGLDRVVLAVCQGAPVACGAMKAFGEDALEVKRMFTSAAHRGLGLGGGVLRALEAWAREDGYARIVLETGRRQPEAIALYTKHGYCRIANYGPYAGVENSVCFEKILTWERLME